ncbi:hypothetical protein JB92DRAFT_491486 [Gautieria morchelliformis]|nr:hypothetical protein JB92DRAFT_491486 [Gautieria morchelliformis]
MTPQPCCLHVCFTSPVSQSQIQPLPSPIPSTSPKPPKTTTNRLSGTLTKYSATLIMVAPKIPSPIVRGGISSDSILFTRLLSVCQWHFRTNPAPSSGAVFSVSVSADGCYLATGSQRGSAQIYDTVTGQRTCVLVHGLGLGHLDIFSPDGRFQ